MGNQYFIHAKGLHAFCGTERGECPKVPALADIVIMNSLAADFDRARHLQSADKGTLGEKDGEFASVEFLKFENNPFGPMLTRGDIIDSAIGNRNVESLEIQVHCFHGKSFQRSQNNIKESA